MKRSLKIHIFLGCLTMLLLAITISRSSNRPFFHQLEAEARAIAESGQVSDRAPLPAELLALDYDQHRRIFWRKDRALFSEQKLPFQVELFHAGGIFDRSVDIYILRSDEPQIYPYDPANFNAPDLALDFPPEIGHAGFRLHYPVNRSDYLDEVAAFQGASYFRALGRGQQYGLSARGLAINTGLANQREEFPKFTRFYLQEPTRNSREFLIYALLESPSVAGAYEMHVAPGEITKIYVKAKLFFMRDVASVGLAPLTSMFWFGENTREKPGDFRPEVHDSDGLLIHDGAATGSGEWTWRPLDNQKFLQENFYLVSNLKGFGLLQRDRDYDHYEDLEARYHLRPSTWVEPIRGFGQGGSVRLIQIPTADEYMDNVVAHWAPNEQPRAGTEMELEYVISWFLASDQLPPLGICTDTRVDYHKAPEQVRFVLDFNGDELKKLSADQQLQPVISTDPGNLVTDVTVMKNEYEGSWRVSFRVTAPPEGRDVDVACLLRHNGRTLTETWRYTWIP